MCVAAIIRNLSILALGATLAGAAGALTLQVPGAPRVSSAQVFHGDGCDGGNLSPALDWSAPPVGTKSLAVTMFDRDAAGGRGWWHWILFDLPAGLRALPANAAARLPEGAVQGRNDFGLTGYGGPCPPRGDPAHHYVLTVWALRSARLAVGGDASGAAIEAALRRDAIARARAILVYGRPAAAR
ncbi:MAG TPA: YbhB/YbcL family Raf kinase inhibitor-like protein [Steroidobacteraceae bacterium]|nr:YbhB/YbcL family Raf kinase inhibitor-like protein [Steroidobacteraceae bacterium]